MAAMPSTIAHVPARAIITTANISRPEPAGSFGSKYRPEDDVSSAGSASL